MRLSQWRHRVALQTTNLQLNEQKMKSYRVLELEILRWAEERRIVPNGKPEIQMLKCVSEVGELADAVAKNDDAKIVDGVGDVMVTLILFCALRDIDLVSCMEVAYDEIKNRKGKTSADGLFIKDAA